MYLPVFFKNYCVIIQVGKNGEHYIMDNTLINNKKYLSVLIAITVAFLCCLFSLSHSQISAYAVTPIEITNITSDQLDSAKFNNENIVEYIQNEYVPPNYGRNITINYELHGVDYLKFASQTDGGEPIMGELIPTSGLDTYSYKVDKDGTVVIDCYAYDALEVLITKISSTVKSDITAPIISEPNINLMSEYIGNTTYNISIDWDKCVDDLSDIAQVFYTFNYDDNTLTDITLTEVDLLEVNTTILPINNNGTLTIFHFDNADNCLVAVYDFDKFDLVPPPIPKITVTPNVNTTLTNGYAKEYLVTIEYFADALSGNADIQSYSVNSVFSEYHEAFIIKYTKDYTIKAYSVDKVGNKSESATAIIAWSTFDEVSPIISTKEFKIDLTKPIIATLSINTTDRESGIDYAVIQTLSKNFDKRIGDTYQANFNPYGLSGFVINVFDKAGNVTIEHYVINYFEDIQLSDKIALYNSKYLTLNRTLYNDAILNEIDNEYAILSTILMATNAQDGQIYAKMNQIDKLFAGVSEHTYEIAAVPIVASTMITYKVTESDFDDYKKGDSVKLVLDSAVSDGVKYIKMTDYKKGFIDYFALKIFYKNSEIAELNNGLEVTMNLPIGYYERQFTLIDMDTKEVIATSIINNQLVFNCKKSTNFALVISGNKEIALTNTSKYIKLFGKKLNYETFFGVVFGVIGAAALTIGVLALIKRKKQ